MNVFCLQMHADDFRFDRYGVVSGLRDGGYSDDMTLAAIAGNFFFQWLYTDICILYNVYFLFWLICLGLEDSLSTPCVSLIILPFNKTIFLTKKKH